MTSVATTYAAHDPTTVQYIQYLHCLIRTSRHKLVRTRGACGFLGCCATTKTHESTTGGSRKTFHAVDVDAKVVQLYSTRQ